MGSTGHRDRWRERETRGNDQRQRESDPAVRHVAPSPEDAGRSLRPSVRVVKSA
jgi:hypothetical protein